MLSISDFFFETCFCLYLRLCGCLVESGGEARGFEWGREAVGRREAVEVEPERQAASIMVAQISIT